VAIFRVICKVHCREGDFHPAMPAREPLSQNFQPIRDLRKRLAVAEQFQHLTLAARQARGVCQRTAKPFSGC